MNPVQPKPVYRQDYTVALKSKEQKMALRAVELIKTLGDLEEFKTLIANGCPQNYFERNPLKPRSSFYTKMVLDSCFESELGIVSLKKSDTYTEATLGATHQSAGRETYFEILLEAGFQGGSNNWRGELIPHILNSCFYTPHNETEIQTRKQAILFSKILLKHNRIDINFYAAHHYQWVGNLEKLNTLLTLGADPKLSATIDCALQYCGCSPNTGETTESRLEVINTLLDLGAIPTKRISVHSSNRHQREALEKGGLLERLKPFGIVEDPVAIAA